ncbi:MAG: ABC transporter ATP-binding protein [Pirellulaceae bacterium]|nr:ABC transporter ATP-binding protein [Pirellulaceae bacterium]
MRAIRLALRYKYSLIASIACSAMVAIFWGANITAVYPFVQIVFQDQTLHSWVDEEIETARSELEKLSEPTIGSDAANPTVAPVNRVVIEKQLNRLHTLKKYADQYAPRDAFQTLICIVVFLLVGTIIKCLFRIASQVLISRVAGRTTADLRGAFLKTLLSDQVNSCDSTSDAAVRIGGDMNSIGTAVQILFGRSIQEPLKMVACLTGAAVLNWRLLAFSLLTTPFAIILLLTLARSIRGASLRAWDQTRRLMGHMMQTFQGLHIVKAYNMENHERRRFRDHTLQVYREQQKISFFNALLRANNEILGIAILCVSAIAGGWLVLNKQTSLMGIPLATRPPDFGQIMLFFAFLIGCTDPLRKIADVYGSLQGGAAAADRIMPFIESSQIQLGETNSIRISDARKPITFENVHFYYSEQKPVLRGVSFQIQCGETLAIVGPNGCGKSTLVNLLLGFVHPSEGRILLGATDLNKIRTKDFRRRISLVTQKPILFNESVRDNIRYGTRSATPAQVVAAAKKAHAHQFIQKQLVKEYETNCGDGGKRLSGGQQQRLTLARAIIRDPDVLILDEAASQIDPNSERLIRESLRSFVCNRTTVIITHRMSTLELADRIMVMDLGQIVDIGTHDELIQRCIVYQSLCQTQFRRSA